jgi:manganese/zinc/iron transport system substrate-binding protein
MNVSGAAIARKLRLPAISLLVCGFFACDTQHTPTQNQEPLLVATTTLAADALHHVAWQGAHIEALMGPGTDPHLFKPSLADVRLLSQADMIVAGGLHLEGKMSDVLHELANQKPVIMLSDSVPTKLLRVAPGSDAADPHIWFNVHMWQLGVRGLGGRLAILYPEHKIEILHNTAKYCDSLATLHKWVLSQAEQVPASQRILVTSHDAFSYFGQAYGYQVKTLQGISTLSDYGLRDVSQLVQFLVDKKVPVLFPETSMPPQTLDAIREASARAGHQVRLGKELYTDALDAPHTPAGTYIGMITYNVGLITHAYTPKP